jgi:hypothetical protein
MRHILVELRVRSILVLAAATALVLAARTAQAAKPEIIDLSEDEVETRGMSCSPQPTEVETRRAIPISCKVEYEAAGVELRYRNDTGTKKWSRIELEHTATGYTGTIPCAATATRGELQVYVFARNEKNKVIARVGRFNAPLKLRLVDRSNTKPPALPGKTAPERCACPPEMQGTEACPGTKPPKAAVAKEPKPQPAAAKKPSPAEKKQAPPPPPPPAPAVAVAVKPAPVVPVKKAWGQSCHLTSECQAALECVAGSCETPAKCDNAADCPVGGECNEGLCHVPDAEELATRLGPPKHHWFGLHLGADLYLMREAAGVCGNRSEDSKNFGCFEGGGLYAGQPNVTAEGHVSAGLHLATVRALLSYDYLVGRFAFGGRLGWAFLGAPQDFLPIHIEARALYALNKKSLDKRFQPYLGLSAGVAQVDAAASVSIIDCTSTSATERQECANEADPALVESQYLAQGPTVAVRRRLNAYHAGSAVFFGPTVMLRYAFSNESALVFTLNAMLPDVALGATVGYAMGL